MGRGTWPILLVWLGGIGACKGTPDPIDTADTSDTGVATAPDTDEPIDVPGPPWSLTVEGFGFFNALGAPARAVVANDENIEIARAEVAIEGGSWTVHWPDILEVGESYYLAVWVDNSGNDICGPNDVAYLYPVTVAEDPLILVPFQQSIDFDACIGWL